MACCKKEKCIPRLLVAIVVFLILNLAVSLICGYYAMENMTSNNRQLYILNEGYVKAEEAKVAQIMSSKNTLENPEFFGEWKSYKSENFEKFMEKLGAPWIMRKLAATANPTVIISRPTDKIIQVASKFVIGSSIQNFTLNEVTQYKPIIGPTVDTILTWLDDKLVAYFVTAGKGDPKKSGNTNIRQILDNGDMLLTIVWDGDVTKRWFKKVKKSNYVVTSPAPKTAPTTSPKTDEFDFDIFK